MVWNAPNPIDSGITGWVGDSVHDHGRVTVQIPGIGIPTMPVINHQKGTNRAGKRRPVQWWRDHAEELETEQQATLSSIGHTKATSPEDTRRHKDAILQGRLQSAKKVDKTSERNRDLTSKRGPHKAKNQRALLREIACLQAADKDSAKEFVTKAELMCLRDSGLEQELGLSPNENKAVVKSREWSLFLAARTRRLLKEVQAITARQIQSTKRALEQEVFKDFLEEHKGPSRFAGKGESTLQPEALDWEVPVGLQVTWEDSAEMTKWAASLKKSITETPTVQVWQSTPSQPEFTMQVWAKPGLENEMHNHIQKAAKRWAWLQAQEKLEVFKQHVRAKLLELVPSQWNKDDIPEPLQEEIWASWRAGLTPSKAAAGTEGIQRGNSVMWAERGELADQMIEKWKNCLQNDEMTNSPFLFQGWKGKLTITHTLSGHSWTTCRETGKITVSEQAQTPGTQRPDKQSPQSTGNNTPFDKWITKKTNFFTAWVNELEQVQHLLQVAVKNERPPGGEVYVMTHNGPWRDQNLERAWEHYLQVQGLPYHHVCVNRCDKEPPKVIPRGPDRSPSEWDSHTYLQGFCPKCWKLMSLREGRGTVGCMDFLQQANAFEPTIPDDQPLRLRGEITENACRAFIQNFLKNGKATGLDGTHAEMMKTLTDAELTIICKWVNSILTTDKDRALPMTVAEMQGRVRLLHKGGDTCTKPSDWRPVVLLNCTNQLVMHILNQRLRDIVERSGWLENGQAGGRQGKGTDINYAMLQQITSEAQRQNQTVYRIDVDFRNAYNAMDQSALWALMRQAKIPDVDLLETMYLNSSVRLQDQSKDGATLTFDTGVAQGSALSPLLFIIFMNTLLRLLTNEGRKENISHGLEGMASFNNLAFVDDLTIFAQSPEKVQKLLNVISKFEDWCGLKVNMKKTCLLVIQQQKNRQPPKLVYKNQHVRMVGEHEPCRYLGFWATANGDMRSMKKKVITRIRQAIEVVRGHPLLPELALEIFKSMAIGVFRYSAPFTPWSEAEMEQIQALWCQGYKECWKLPQCTASAAFVLPQGLGLPTPYEVLAQASIRHLDRLRNQQGWIAQGVHEALTTTIEDQGCNSWSDLQHEMTLRSWDEACANKWTRLAKLLAMLNINIPTLDNPEAMKDDKEQPASWAEVTRKLRHLRKKVESLGGSRDTWCSQIWDLAQEEWKLLWEGDLLFWKHIKRLRAAGLHNPQLCPQEERGWDPPTGLEWTELGPAIGEGWRILNIPQLTKVLEDRTSIREEEWNRWKAEIEIPPLKYSDCVKAGDNFFKPAGGWKPWKLPRAVRSQESGGLQTFRILIPRVKGINSRDHRALQRWLDLVDWEAETVQRSNAKIQEGIHAAAFQRPPTRIKSGEVRHTHPAWNFLRKSWKAQTKEAEEETVMSIPQCAQHLSRQCSQKHPEGTENHDNENIETTAGLEPFHVVAGLASLLWRPTISTNLPDVMKNLFTHLPPGWQTKWQQIATALKAANGHQMAKDLYTHWMRHTKQRCGECQTCMTAHCDRCGLPRCTICQQGQCAGCNVETNCKGIQERHQHAQVKKRRKPETQGCRIARDVHNVGRAFVAKVTDVRRNHQAEAQSTTSSGEHLEFCCHIRGEEEIQTWCNRLQNKKMSSAIEAPPQAAADNLIPDLTLWRLKDWLLHQRPEIPILLPRENWPESPPPKVGTGWWYSCRTDLTFRTCRQCQQRQPRQCFDQTEWTKTSRVTCVNCKSSKNPRASKKRKSCKEDRTHWAQERGNEGEKAERSLQTPNLRKRKKIQYCEESEDDGENEDDGFEQQPVQGLVFDPAEPDYLNYHDRDEGAQVILTMEEVRDALLRQSKDRRKNTSREQQENGQDPYIRWLTTKQMGFALEEEQNEIVNWWDAREGKGTARYLAPAISHFVRNVMNVKEGASDEEAQARHEAFYLDQMWGKWDEDASDNDDHPEQNNDPPKTARWECRETPPAAKDPLKIPDNFNQGKQSGNTPIAQQLSQRGDGEGFVRIFAKSTTWFHHGAKNTHSCQGLTTHTTLGESWTLASSNWTHLLATCGKNDKDLTRFVKSEIEYQDKIEEQGYRSPTNKVLRALQDINKATTVNGESAIAVQPIFLGARRGNKELWGKTDDAQVILWDSLQEDDKAECIKQMASNTKWVVWKAMRKDNNNPNEEKLQELGTCIFQSSTRDQASSRQNDGPKEKSSRTVKTKGWWRRGDIHTGISTKVMQCWVHTDMCTELNSKKGGHRQEPIVSDSVQALKTAWEDDRQRDDLYLDLQGPGRHFWAGTEAGLLGAYNFQGIQAGGDGSAHQQRMGAGVWCRHAHDQEWSVRVGRETEGTNSKRPELAALASTLRAVHTKSPLLYLCDNEAVLQDITKWIGEGHKTSMALNKDADIMHEIIQRLHARVQAGAATFLLKVKSHRGEALNEMADAAAEHGRGRGEEEAAFTKASGRLILQVERKDKVVQATWNKGIQAAIQWQGGQYVVRQRQSHGAKVWAQIRLRRSTQPWLQPTAQEKEVFNRKDFITDENWGQRCLSDLFEASPNRKILSTWCEDFLLQQEVSRDELTAWLANKDVPWKRKRRLLQAITLSFPCSAWLHKIGVATSDKCIACHKVSLRQGLGGEAIGKGTYGHIQSAACLATKEAVTAAHNKCLNALIDAIIKHKKKKSSITFIKEDTDVSFKTAWQNSELQTICTAQQIEQAAVQEYQALNSNPTVDQQVSAVDVEQLWRRRPDRIAINRDKKIIYIIEFKRTIDLRPSYQTNAEDRAEKQHNWLTNTLSKAAAPMDWAVQTVIFTGGTMGSVKIDRFEQNLTRLEVKKKAWTKIRKMHARALLEAQDTVLRAYYNAVYASHTQEVQHRHHVTANVYV